jgi:glycerophosphoryl diester phosphodiesterase
VCGQLQRLKLDVDQLKNDIPFLNIAHRGGRAFAPENTIPAIRLVRRLGANAVELDLQMSRDGELIVFHDDDVMRCSDGFYKYPLHNDYTVSAFTWEELLALDVGMWYVQELAKPPSRRQPYLRDLEEDEVRQCITMTDADEYESGSVRIPRLRDALLAARESELAVVLDVKTIPRRYPAIVTKALEVIADLGMEQQTLITSFDHVLLADVRRQNRTIATGVLTAERLHHPRDYVEALDADAFEPACTAEADVIRRGVEPGHIDRELIAELTSAGLMVNVWTENAESRMRTLIDAGVTGIFTDYPNRLARVLSLTGREVPVCPRLRRASR